MTVPHIYKALHLIERHPAPFARALVARGELTLENFADRFLYAVDGVLGEGTVGRIGLGIRTLPGRDQTRLMRRLIKAAVGLLPKITR